MINRDASRALQCLESDGFFMEEDLPSISLSVQGNEAAVVEAIRAAGWSGDVIVSAHEGNGEWPYYCYDPDRFTRAEIISAVEHRMRAREV